MEAQGLQEDYLPGQKPPPRQPWDEGPPAPEPEFMVIKCWFEDPPKTQIERALAPHLRSAEVGLNWVPVVENDWESAWQESFPRLELSEHFAIAAPWNAEPGDLCIEPGQGFGTGQHETTAAIVRVLDPLLHQTPSPRFCLDIGCGSGILGLLAARKGLRVHGIDIDQNAIDNARHNADLNGLTASFDTTPIESLGEPADLVVANLYAEMLVKVHYDLLRLTTHHLILAGILRQKEHSVRSIYDAELGEPERVVDGEWICLHYRRQTHA